MEHSGQTYVYTSPLRKAGLDWICRRNDLRVVWEHTEIGPWFPDQEFALNGPVPDEMANQMDLVLRRVI